MTLEALKELLDSLDTQLAGIKAIYEQNTDTDPIAAINAEMAYKGVVKYRKVFVDSMKIHASRHLKELSQELDLGSILYDIDFGLEMLKGEGRDLSEAFIDRAIEFALEDYKTELILENSDTEPSELDALAKARLEESLDLTARKATQFLSEYTGESTSRPLTRAANQLTSRAEKNTLISEEERHRGYEIARRMSEELRGDSDGHMIYLKQHFASLLSLSNERRLGAYLGWGGAADIIEERTVEGKSVLALREGALTDSLERVKAVGGEDIRLSDGLVKAINTVLEAFNEYNLIGDILPEKFKPISGNAFTELERKITDSAGLVRGKDGNPEDYSDLEELVDEYYLLGQSLREVVSVAKEAFSHVEGVPAYAVPDVGADLDSSRIDAEIKDPRITPIINSVYSLGVILRATDISPEEFFASPFTTMNRALDILCADALRERAEAVKSGGATRLLYTRGEANLTRSLEAVMAPLELVLSMTEDGEALGKGMAAEAVFREKAGAAVTLMSSAPDLRGLGDRERCAIIVLDMMGKTNELPGSAFLSDGGSHPLLQAESVDVVALADHYLEDQPLDYSGMSQMSERIGDAILGILEMKLPEADERDAVNRLRAIAGRVLRANDPGVSFGKVSGDLVTLINDPERYVLELTKDRPSVGQISIRKYEIPEAEKYIPERPIKDKESLAYGQAAVKTLRAREKEYNRAANSLIKDMGALEKQLKGADTEKAQRLERSLGEKRAALRELQHDEALNLCFLAISGDVTPTYLKARLEDIESLKHDRRAPLMFAELNDRDKYVADCVARGISERSARRLYSEGKAAEDKRVPELFANRMRAQKPVAFEPMTLMKEGGYSFFSERDIGVAILDWNRQHNNRSIPGFDKSPYESLMAREREQQRQDARQRVQLLREEEAFIAEGKGLDDDIEILTEDVGERLEIRRLIRSIRTEQEKAPLTESPAPAHDERTADEVQK